MSPHPPPLEPGEQMPDCDSVCVCEFVCVTVCVCVCESVRVCDSVTVCLWMSYRQRHSGGSFSVPLRKRAFF